MFEEYQVLLVHPCPEEGNENIRFIVNVVSSLPASSQGNPLQVICLYASLIIHVFFTALCGASTSVSFILSEFVSCAVRGVAKRAGCFLKAQN